MGKIPNGVWLLDCVLQLLGIAVVLAGLITAWQQRETPAGISGTTWLLLTLGVAIIVLGSMAVAILATYYRYR